MSERIRDFSGRLSPDRSNHTAHVNGFAAAHGDGAAENHTLRVLPPSFSQERLWFLEALEGPSPRYNISRAWHLRGRLDRATLARSLDLIVARHEALRTTFAATPGNGRTVAQIVHPTSSISLEYTDLGARPLERGIKEAERRAIAIAAQTFDLKRGPLLRAHLFELGPEDHLFFIVVHHIVFDAASMSVLEEEMATAYRDLVAGRAPSLPPVALQMGDYARQERARMAGARLDEELDFWRGYLEGSPPMIELPPDAGADVDAESAPSLKSASAGRVLDGDSLDRLLRLARTERCTMFHALLAAWSIVLGRHAGLHDFVIGTPISNRDDPACATMVGFAVNTLPLRIRIEPGGTVRGLLHRVRDSVLAALEHAEVPLDRLVQELHPRSGRRQAPLFPSIITFEPDSEHPESFGDLDWFVVDFGGAKGKFDLTLSLRDTEEGLVAAIDYVADVFSPDRMERVLAHLDRVIAEMGARPDSRVDDLQMLTPAEWDCVVRQWNQTRVDYPREARIEDLFAAQARERPDAIAIACRNQRLTYRELHERISWLAGRLRRAGVRPGSLVAVRLDRSIELVVALLAILRAGAAAVPIATENPPERLRFILADTAASLLITRGHVFSNTQPPGTAVLDLDRKVAPAARESPLPDDESRGDAGAVAFVVYTSGSTGTPKGVSVPHRAIVRLVRGQSYVSFSPEERFLFLASPAFDAMFFELWGPLLNGATCAIFPDRWPDLARLERCVRAHEVTCLWLTAGLFNQIIDQRPALLSGIRQVVTGGEAISPKHARRALESFPGLRLTNGYGPTEGTTFACTYAIPADFDFSRSVPIGRPIANTCCYILDDRGHPAPIGVAGELHIGGDGLALGYHNRPELTAAKFLPDPFSDDPDARLYRTGDRCRWREDGTIEFLGRLDDQVKVRGFRVEPAEVEQALALHPGVAQAVVVARRAAAGSQELSALVLPKEGAAVGPEILRDHLSARLPPYMVPASFAFVRGPWPLTPNGKIDRQALLARTAAATRPGNSSVGSRTVFEAELVAVWRQVLQRENVGVTEDFFDLGGNSLLALQLTHEVSRRFGHPLELAQFLARPTIEAVASALMREAAGETSRQSGLRGSGPGTPLFHIPGPAGVELLPPAITRRLEGERPYFDGLHFPGADGSRAPSDSVVEIAAELVRQIRRVQANGPYCLSGYCFGGMVAYEVGRQLEQAGQRVTTLVLWDAFPAFSFQNRPLAGILRVALRRMRQAGWRESLRLICNRVGDAAAAAIDWRLLRFLARREASRSPSQDAPVRDPGLIQRRVVSASKRAHAAYRPGRPCSARIVLCRTRSSLEPVFAEMLPLGGWEWILPNLEVHEFEGGHLELTKEPQVSDVAELTARILREGDANRRN